ncbi:MAG: histidine--tRNA ligase [Flavobacteriales bacterium]|nr:histidine--tRNA ligase [Bacteroidota bacterium]MCB9240330.1 histidine--tRNA ligase [Flavobacteriales bacterium]
MQKPTLPKGTRDFGPVELKRRKLIINTIQNVYEHFGFEPLETPAMENLSTLTGKYGDEGDALLFKILNSGDFLKKVDEGRFQQAKENPNSLLPQISEKGLRYDLTVPLARFVVQHQHELQFPFKRYQIQPVWRADRPQKGRYREFWQCDADVIGTDSLVCESDFVKIYQLVFNALGFTSYDIRINHRSLLEAIAQTVGFNGPLTQLTVSIDKLDKIGWEGVGKELESNGFTSDQVSRLQVLLTTSRCTPEFIEQLASALSDGEAKDRALMALRELRELTPGIDQASVSLDLSLARGLDYYTGFIFEASIPDSGIGSVSGGGRYDNLTGVFGLSGVSGVGISFGIDRLYDCMDALGLFGGVDRPTANILLCHFDERTRTKCAEIADALRADGIKTEVYPDIKKLRKQLDYANKRGYPFIGVVGEEEFNQDTIQLKNMESGDQSVVPQSNLSKLLK